MFSGFIYFFLIVTYLIQFYVWIWYLATELAKSSMANDDEKIHWLKTFFYLIPIFPLLYFFIKYLITTLLPRKAQKAT